jgi:broad specificity phosphatase PhoE
MRVWLIRHAATTAPRGMAIGWGDPPLSEVGRSQARGLAAELAHRLLLQIWSSDSRRAIETAAAVAAPHRLLIETTPALREIDFGAWEGRDLGELWCEDPDGARAWEVDIRRTPASFGESFGGLEERVRSFWTQAARGAGEIAIVAHRGSLSCLRSVITGMSAADSLASPIEVAGCLGFDINEVR